MPDTMVLYLRADETKLFLGLSKELQDGWKIVEETLEAFERPEERKMRSLMMHTKAEKFRQAILERSALPKDLSAEALFALGAEGISMIIALLLQSPSTDDDIKGIVELSQIRHALLASNAQHSPSLS